MKVYVQNANIIGRMYNEAYTYVRDDDSKTVSLV